MSNSFRYLGNNEFVDEPEVELRTPAGYCVFVVNTKDECVDVIYISSNYKGGMKEMMDNIMSQIRFTTVRFVHPWDDNDKAEAEHLVEAMSKKLDVPVAGKGHEGDLRDALNNYDELEITYGTEETTVLITEWDVPKL